MKNYKEIFMGKKGVIMGLGLLGGALNDAKFLLDCGADLIITDTKTEAELAPSIKKLKSWRLKAGNFVLHLGGHQIEDFKGADFILQPGNVPADSPYLLEARKNNISIHESESLFMQYADGVKVIGITGTRGKTTTTFLIYEILKSAFGWKVYLGLNSFKKAVGRKTFIPKVFLGGNVKGSSTLALLSKVKPGDIVVLELDSWCLHGIGEIKKSPQISVFTNLLPDHLNYYLKGSRDEVEAMQKYFTDKAQIFANQKTGDYLILDDEMKKIIGERYKKEIKSQIVLIKDNPEVRKWKLKIKGEHNFKHVLRAAAVAKILGVNEKIIKKTVENFAGVEGRQEFVGEYKGIKIYNDTTATTPDATIVALKSLGDIKNKNIVLIMGGADKSLDMSGLLKEIPKYCKKVFLLPGTGSSKLNMNEAVKCDSLKEAVGEAIISSKEGDILLFSPAFASFGMFKNEYDRGEKFVKIIKSLK